VRMKGLEPPWIAPPDPKSGASASFATSACGNALLKMRGKSKILFEILWIAHEVKCKTIFLAKKKCNKILKGD
jgi:hypothetical protein